ncbi:MAG: hypothetical protein AAF677_05625 [Pseudomonadota bacterium]
MAPGQARIGIVCGLVAERETLGPLLDHPRVAVAVSGARPALAETEAAALAEAGCDVLVSYGLAGGLAPGLTPGTLIWPRHVVSESGEDWTMEDVAAATAASRTGRTVERLLGLERVAVMVSEKQALAAASGAAAVDMESHRVARVAAARGRRTIAWRAIGDPASRALPALAANAVRRDGRPDIPSVLLGLLRRPLDLPKLMAAKRDSDAALTALAASVPLLRDHLEL